VPASLLERRDGRLEVSGGVAFEHGGDDVAAVGVRLPADDDPERDAASLPGQFLGQDRGARRGVVQGVREGARWVALLVHCVSAAALGIFKRYRYQRGHPAVLPQKPGERTTTLPSPVLTRSE
jgi:hypothetical protein